MTDTPATPVAGTGAASSEFSLTRIVTYAGIAITVAAAALQAFVTQWQAQGGVVSWAPTVIAALGIGMTLVQAMGYTRGRNALKTAELASAGAVEVAKLIPLLQGLVQMVRSPPPDGPPAPAPLPAPSPATPPSAT